MATTQKRQLVCQTKGYLNICAPEGESLRYAETFEQATDALENDGPWNLILLSEHLIDNSSEKIARWIADHPDKRSKYLYFLNVNEDKLALLREILEPLYPGK